MNVAKIIANFAHATLHILDDWAAENAQTGEVTVEIPADQWKELNRVLDLLGDDPHEVLHDAIGVNDPPMADPVPTPAYDRDKYPTACLAVEAFVAEYVDGYEMLGEDADGREGYYQPNDFEEQLIRDALAGLHADEQFVDLVAAEHAERQARRAAEGCCLTCGASNGQHWGARCSTSAKLELAASPPRIARWRCVSYCRCGNSKGHFERDDAGVWVLFEDLAR